MCHSGSFHSANGPCPTSRNFATRAIHAGEQFSVADNAIFPAIVTASSFTKRSLDDKPEYSQPRGQPHPACLRNLRSRAGRGRGCRGLRLGVNATATVLELLPKDAHVVVMNGVRGTFRILEDYRSRTSGLTTTYVDLNDLGAVAAAIKPETQLIWIESPTNPLLHLVDIKAVRPGAGQGHPASTTPSARRGTSARSTWGGPGDALGQQIHWRPLRPDWRVVVAATTLLARLRHQHGHRRGAGAVRLLPGLRGLKTLDVRMERQCANACRWRAFWKTTRRWSRCITRLESHPQHELCKRQMRSGGAVVAMKVRATAPRSTAWSRRCRSLYWPTRWAGWRA